jgi:hypothetical protein
MKVVGRQGAVAWGRLEGVPAPGGPTSEKVLSWARRGRRDAPARIHRAGQSEWEEDGITHRADGAAVLYADGHYEWWFNGYAQGGSM